MISLSEQGGVRYLHFGTPLVQGAMRIARPHALELEYTRDMMLPLLLRDCHPEGRHDGHPEGRSARGTRLNGPARTPRSILQVGLGAASITKFLLRACPEAKLTVVELREEVISIAYQYFKLPDDAPNLRIVQAEGFDWLSRPRKPFDWIIVDGFDGDGHAGALDSAQFYHAVRAHLTSRGMLSVNLVGKRAHQAAARERIAEAFEGRFVAMEREADGNSIVVAAVGDPVACEADALRASAAALGKAAGGDFRATAERALGRRAMSGEPLRL